MAMHTLNLIPPGNYLACIVNVQSIMQSSSLEFYGAFTRFTLSIESGPARGRLIVKHIQTYDNNENKIEEGIAELSKITELLGASANNKSMIGKMVCAKIRNKNVFQDVFINNVEEICKIDECDKI